LKQTFTPIRVDFSFSAFWGKSKYFDNSVVFYSLSPNSAEELAEIIQRQLSSDAFLFYGVRYLRYT